MKQVNTRQADAAGAPESSRAFTRSLMNRFVQAGLLALPTFAAFSSRPARQWQQLAKAFTFRYGITVAGTASGLHGIPFSSRPMRNTHREPVRCKINR